MFSVLEAKDADMKRHGPHPQGPIGRTSGLPISSTHPSLFSPIRWEITMFLAVDWVQPSNSTPQIDYQVLTCARSNFRSWKHSTWDKQNPGLRGLIFILRKKISVKKWANTRGSKELCFLHKTGWCDRESLGAGWRCWSGMASCQWMTHHALLRWSDGTITGQTLRRTTESASHVLQGPRGGSKDFCSGWRCSEGMALGEEGFWLWLPL